MYSRTQSSADRRRLKIPENYRGHAFDESGLYSDIPPSARNEQMIHDMPERIPKTEEALPRAPETLPESRPTPEIPEPIVQNDNTKPAEPPKDPIYEKFTARQAQMYETTATDIVPVSSNPKASIFSSLFPPSLMTSHFPFGHGIGSEEILILGMMLIVYMSGENGEPPDGELIMLLALLLFAG